MSDVIIVAILSFAGTVIGSIGGVLASNKLTNYRIEQLEKKVDRYTCIETRITEAEASIRSAHYRINELRDHWEHTGTSTHIL